MASLFAVCVSIAMSRPAFPYVRSARLLKPLKDQCYMTKQNALVADIACRRAHFKFRDMNGAAHIRVCRNACCATIS